MPINPRWIDQAGKGDALAGITDIPDLPFGSSGIPLVDEDEWRDRAEASTHLRELVQKVKNQKSEPSCASNSAAQNLELVTVIQLGQQHWIELSAISLYKRVGSRRSGSYLSDNLRELTTGEGILPVNKPETKAFLEDKGFPPHHVFPETGYNVPFPQDWQQTAAQFRIFPDEVYRISNMQEFASCIFAGHPVSYGRAGHAITGVDVVYEDGKFYICYVNSWGNWGDNGFGYDSFRYVERNGGDYGAWCCRAARLDIYQED